MSFCGDVKPSSLDFSRIVLQHDGGRGELWEVLGVECLLQLPFLYSPQPKLWTGWSPRDHLVHQVDLLDDPLSQNLSFLHFDQELVQGDDVPLQMLRPEGTARGWL